MRTSFCICSWLVFVGSAVPFQTKKSSERRNINTGSKTTDVAEEEEVEKAARALGERLDIHWQQEKLHNICERRNEKEIDSIEGKGQQ